MKMSENTRASKRSYDMAFKLVLRREATEKQPEIIGIIVLRLIEKIRYTIVLKIQEIRKGI